MKGCQGCECVLDPDLSTLYFYTVFSYPVGEIFCKDHFYGFEYVS